MAVETTYEKITVPKKANYVCPFCHHFVNPNDKDAAMIRKKGSKVEEWFHKSCFREDSYGSR